MEYPFLTENGDPLFGAVFPSNGNRINAVNYAIDNSTTDTTNASFVNLDNNCTNFASQTLSIGGLSQDDIWKAGSPGAILGGCGGSVPGIELGGQCPSSAWSVATQLKAYLLSKYNFKVITTGISSSGTLTPLTYSDYKANIQGGDILIFYQGGPNTPANHAGVVIGWGPPYDGSTNRLSFNSEYIPWFADNTGAQHIRPINDLSSPSPLIEIIHITY